MMTGIGMPKNHKSALRIISSLKLKVSFVPVTTAFDHISSH